MSGDAGFLWVDTNCHQHKDTTLPMRARDALDLARSFMCQCCFSGSALSSAFWLRAARAVPVPIRRHDSVGTDAEAVVLRSRGRRQVARAVRRARFEGLFSARVAQSLSGGLSPGGHAVRPARSSARRGSRRGPRRRRRRRRNQSPRIAEEGQSRSSRRQHARCTALRATRRADLRLAIPTVGPGARGLEQRAVGHVGTAPRRAVPTSSTQGNLTLTGARRTGLGRALAMEDAIKRHTAGLA